MNSAKENSPYLMTKNRESFANVNKYAFCATGKNTPIHPYKKMKNTQTDIIHQNLC